MRFFRLMVAVLMSVGAAGLSACASDLRPDRRGLERPSRVVVPEALLFLEYDTNHDRVIDRAELEAGIARSWQEVAHGADAVSLIAVRDWLTEVLGASDLSWSATSFNRNFNGRVTQAQFHDEIVREFERLNTGHDDRLTRAQLLQSLPQDTRIPAQRPAAQDRPEGRRRR
jgi:hypothetical protein